jgi:hypothetical protein
MPDPTLLDTYHQARAAKQETEATAKAAAAEFRDAEQALLDAMADEGISTVGTDKFTVSTSRTLRVQTVGDKAAAAERLAAHGGFDAFVKRDFNLNSLSAHVRELAEKQPDIDPRELLPADVRDDLSVFEQYRLNFRSK